ncbi:hypothetical protein ABBQ38_012692 [Trebouxia sp. C0009 RCD-2024]
MQDAIQEKKKVLAEKAATLRRTLGRSKGEALDPLDDSSLSRSAKADLFEYLCLEGQQHQRDVELNALQPMVGSDPLTPPQLTRMQEARQQHQEQAPAAQRQADTLRQAAAASSVRPVSSQDTSTPARDNPYGEAEGQDRPTLPRWDCNDGDTWHKRQRALYCFAQAGRKVILRNRANHRLARINALVQKLKRPDEAAAASSNQAAGPRHAMFCTTPLIGQPTAASASEHATIWETLHTRTNQQITLYQSPRDGMAAAFHLEASKVAPAWPVHTNEPAKQYKPVAIPDFSVDFASYQPMEPQVPQHSELMGYTEEPLPAYTPYAPQMLDMPLMEGPFEEEAGPHPTGLVPDMSDWMTMPETCLIRRQPNLPIGDRYSTDKVQVQLGRDWGHDQGSAIQPCIYPLSSTAQLELPESSSVRALAGQPVLSDLFVPFRQPVQTQTGSNSSSPVKKQKLDLVSAFRTSLQTSDGPAQQVHVPTEADIRESLPADLDYMQPHMSGDELSQQRRSTPAANPDGEIQATENRKLPVQLIQTDVQKHSRQLDAKLLAAKQDNLNRMQARFTEYNSHVRSRNWLP